MAAAGTAKKRALILLWQDGGPSHLETFDPKPLAPSEYRGELGAISTSLPGVAYCEVLPRLARLADRTAIIRSLHQPSSGHVVGSHNVLTGWYDQTDGGKSRYPDLAAVISRMRSGAESSDVVIGASTDPRLARGMRGPAASRTDNGGSAALPRYIDIGRGIHRGGPAFLGPIDGPFQVAGDPSKPGFVIQNLDSVADAQRFLSRGEMLRQLDKSRPLAAAHAAGLEQLSAVDAFRQQAVELLSGGAAARAFDLSREHEATRERYGRHLAGQQCLLARRLVEAGVGVVAVRFSPDGRGDYDRTMIGWDDHAVHGNIFEIMRQRGPQFDQSLSALVEDLEQRGMQDDVLLVVMGEFGRTPRIHVHKGCPGREHWGPAGCALVYGGGLTMGQVIGSTNDKGENPLDRPLTYQDLLATMYGALGINPAHTFVNQSGRPVPILPEGGPISELTGSPTRPARADRLWPRAIVTEFRPATTLATGATNDEFANVAGRAVLQSLNLCDTRIDDHGLAAIAQCRALRRLQLNGTPITDAGLVHLRGLSMLEELHLTGTRTTDAGLIHLKSLAHLRRLECNGTSISLAGIVRLFVAGQERSLVDALAALGLVHFDPLGQAIAMDVAGTSLGDEELKHLGSPPGLRELHLADTRITDGGLASLRGLPALERLFLTKCNVTDAGLAQLARFSRLQSLNLVGTKITSAGLAHLAGLGQLRTLYVTDLKLSPTAVDQLKARLRQLSVTDYAPV
jgi:hypothetical protein